MTTSRQELITLSLAQLGIPGAGQTASAEDVASVDKYVDGVMSDLATRNIWQWGDPDEIDDAASIHLAVILANQAKPDVLAQDSSEEVRVLAEKRLRALNTAVLSGQRQTTEYF